MLVYVTENLVREATLLRVEKRNMVRIYIKRKGNSDESSLSNGNIPQSAINTQYTIHHK